MYMIDWPRYDYPPPSGSALPPAHQAGTSNRTVTVMPPQRYSNVHETDTITRDL